MNKYLKYALWGSVVLVGITGTIFLVKQIAKLKNSKFCFKGAKLKLSISDTQKIELFFEMHNSSDITVNLFKQNIEILFDGTSVGKIESTEKQSISARSTMQLNYNMNVALKPILAKSKSTILELISTIKDGKSISSLLGKSVTIKVDIEANGIRYNDNFEMAISDFFVDSGEDADKDSIMCQSEPLFGVKI